jgi:glucose-1-phosphate thymidylyltransferase
MKRAIILSGGFGTRLLPLTEAINKHLLPIGEEPMIYHPIKRCVEAGLDEILIVTGGNCSDGFLTLLKDGKHLGVRQLYYAHQMGAGGIAEALKLGESFVGNENFAVILGDNIFTSSIRTHVQEYQERIKTNPQLAQIHLYKVDDPQRFGCPEFNDFGEIINIVEKPKNPPSNFAVVGVYFYPASIFKDVLGTLKPSKRGELEITDCNNYYLHKGLLNHGVLEGEWSDAGTWKSWWEANNIVRNNVNNK